MDAPARPLSRAPAWIFLACTAVLASLFAAASLWQGRGQPAPEAGKPRFGLKGLADATPAPKAEAASVAVDRETPAPKPAEPRRRETPPIEKPEKPEKPRPAVAPSVATAPAPAPVPVPVAAPAPAPTPAPAAAASSAPIRPVAPDSKLQSSAPVSGDSLYGTRHSGKFSVAGLTLPLPPGEWRVAADVPVAQGRDLALVRESGGMIAAIGIFSFNWSGNGLGYAKGSLCSRRALRSGYEKAEDFGDQLCWSVTLAVTKSLIAYQPKTAVGRALIGEVGPKLDSIRSDVVVDTAFLIAGLQRRVIALYYFNPDAEGIASKSTEQAEDSEWHPKNISQHPEKVKFLRERLQWAAQAYPEMKTAFAGWN